jgi:hypothetical protein
MCVGLGEMKCAGFFGLAKVCRFSALAKSVRVLLHPYFVGFV